MKRPPREIVDYTNWTLEQVKDELRTKQMYLDYFEKFDPNSIEEFIDRYAPIKLQMIENQDRYKKGTDFFKGRFIELADKYIDMILQKKLFNLQCQWRAGLIQLPLVRICRDFEYWSQHIRACPFIPIITPQEIELCISFLHQEYDFYADATIFGNKWQDYEQFKYAESQQGDYDEDNDEEEQAPFAASGLPPLYLYFDTYQNTSGLINLPDIRGDKEEQYLAIYRDIEKFKEEQLAAQTPVDVAPPVPTVSAPYRPRLFWGNEDIKTFVETVEEPDVIDAHTYYYENYQFDRDFDFEECLIYLRDFKEPFPIEAHNDWREAVRLVLLRQTQLKAADMLPYVYETYLMEFDKPYNLKKIMADKIASHKYDPQDVFYQVAESFKEYIFIGRKALQGDDDVDYLE